MAVAQSVQFTCGLKPRSLVFFTIFLSSPFSFKFVAAVQQILTAIDLETECPAITMLNKFISDMSIKIPMMQLASEKEIQELHF
jgi:hypothetical protein